MSWARRAVYAVSPHPHEWKRIYESRSVSDQEECLKAVTSRWVSDQKNCPPAHRYAHNWSIGLRLTGLLLALTGWGLSAYLFLAGWLLRSEHVPTRQPATAAGEPTVAVSSGTSTSPIGDPPHATAPGATAEVAEQGDTGRGPDARHPEPFVLIFSSLLVISGGLIIAYGEHRGHDAHARQYSNMHTVFERGESQLGALLAARKWDQARNVIEALGDEALVEHVQWLILHRRTRSR